MPLTVSVVTPSFNQGQYIERTIRSVLSQDIAGLEYVIFDGGSTDSTVSVLKQYEDRARWVSESDRGQTHAVNKGISVTSGDIIGWLNSDDVYYPGAIQTARDFFDAHPDVDLVYGNADYIDEHDQLLTPYQTEPWNIERLYEHCIICQPAAFLRRRAVERFGLLDERLHFCMDYEYWVRLALGGAKVSHIEVPLAGSRLYPETKTVGSRVAAHAEVNTMFRTKLGATPDRWIMNYAHAVVEERGMTREQRARFALALAVTSWYASFRWNHSVSPEVIRTTAWWVKANFSATLRERVGL